MTAESKNSALTVAISSISLLIGAAGSSEGSTPFGLSQCGHAEKQDSHHDLTHGLVFKVIECCSTSICRSHLRLNLQRLSLAKHTPCTRVCSFWCPFASGIGIETMAATWSFDTCNSFPMQIHREPYDYRLQALPGIYPTPPPPQRSLPTRPRR